MKTAAVFVYIALSFILFSNSLASLETNAIPVKSMKVLVTNTVPSNFIKALVTNTNQTNSITALVTNSVKTNSLKDLVARAKDHRPFGLNEILDMQEASKFLQTSEKSAFYDQYCINGGLLTGAFFLNFILPGSGNMLIGDFGGGLALMVPTLAGVVTSVVLVFTYWNFAPVGLFVLFVTEPLGWIIPFTYAGGWNKDLKAGLRLVDQENTKPKFKPISSDRTTFNGSYNGDRTIEFQLASFSF